MTPQQGERALDGLVAIARFVPHGRHDQRWNVGDLQGEVLQQPQRSLPGPLQVFEYEHDRTALDAAPNRALGGIEEAEALPLGEHARDVLLRRRQVGGDLGSELPEDRQQGIDLTRPRLRREHRREVGNRGEPAEHLGPHPEGRGAFAILAARGDHLKALARRLLSEHLGQAGLAHTGRPGDHDESGLAAPGHGLARSSEAFEGGRPSDEVVREENSFGGPGDTSRSRLVGRPLHRGDVADEAIAPSGEALEDLAPSRVADRASRLADGAVQRAGGHDGVGPEPLHQLVQGDHPAPLPQQKREQLEGLGLQRHGLAGAAQLSGLFVELEDPEPKTAFPELLDSSGSGPQLPGEPRFSDARIQDSARGGPPNNRIPKAFRASGMVRNRS